jgi:hypothetical protein
MERYDSIAADDQDRVETLIMSVDALADGPNQCCYRTCAGITSGVDHRWNPWVLSWRNLVDDQDLAAQATVGQGSRELSDTSLDLGGGRSTVPAYKRAVMGDEKGDRVARGKLRPRLPKYALCRALHFA